MSAEDRLKRSLTLKQMVLYGLGTTVGAGIYALLGEITAVAGYQAAWSFLVAAGLATLTAVSFAALSRRYPRAAGIALYIQNGFGSVSAARLAGLLAILAGMVSSAALLNGFVGYLQDFVALDRVTIILFALGALCALACWGVAQSVWAAAVVTLLEVGGLLWVMALALLAADVSVSSFAALGPPTSGAGFVAVAAGAVLAFYAYIGFEDMVEVAEEVEDVRVNLPKAIIWTLVLTGTLYVCLIVAALLAIPPATLAGSTAPLALIVSEVSDYDSRTISAIGLLAIINGALIQVIMASRVVYGLASRAQLPRWLAAVHPSRQTPARATVLVSVVIAVLALIGTTAQLAEVTSVILLTLFAAVNASLWRLERNAERRTLRVTAGCGAITCLLLVAHTLWRWWGAG